MKKIIFIIAGVFVGLVGYSQSNDATNAAAKRLTVEEANKLNGVAQPTINGIPYSQYKAQQEALKQAQAAANAKVIAATTNTPATATGANGKAVQAPASKVSTGTVSATDNPGSAKAQSNSPAAIPTITTMPVEKTAVKQTDVPSPATQTIPAQTLKTSPVNETPVSVAGKPIVDANGANTGGTNATLVPLPRLGTTTDNGTQPAVVTPQNKMPEQTLGQAKPTEAVVTPPSVINNSKAPVKQN